MDFRLIRRIDYIKIRDRKSCTVPMKVQQAYNEIDGSNRINSNFESKEQ